MTSLFDPIQLGAISAANRVFMAPLTRGRGTRDHVPTQVMVDYYRQRAGAGLIIAEATGISRQGLGWPFAPGIWNDAQVESWRPVAEAVHAAGGRIFMQLWHMGRLVHPSFLDGEAPVSASAMTGAGEAHTYDGKQPYTQARALETSEIPGIVDDYRRAAANAIRAGVDGVQIHGANTYLIDQFLRDSTNQRTDRYGGSIENRIRLLKEVTSAVVDEIGADRVAVRLSPANEGVNDSDPRALFTAAADMLGGLGIAFLELREPESDNPIAPAMREAFGGPFVLNSNYDQARAEAALAAGEADAIAFGRPFISNPDLARRMREGLPLAAPAEFQHYYDSAGARGYSDFPALENEAV